MNHGLFVRLLLDVSTTSLHLRLTGEPTIKLTLRGTLTVTTPGSTTVPSPVSSRILLEVGPANGLLVDSRDTLGPLITVYTTYWTVSL